MFSPPGPTRFRIVERQLAALGMCLASVFGGLGVFGIALGSILDYKLAILARSRPTVKILELPTTCSGMRLPTHR